MAKDERLYARPINADDFPYSNERHYPAFVYLIWWPTDNGIVAKAGISRTTRRWRHFLGRGGQLSGLWQAEQWNALESRLHGLLAEVGALAFDSRAEGLPLLGSVGGHTECYRLLSADAESHLSRIALEATHG